MPGKLWVGTSSAQVQSFVSSSSSSHISSHVSSLPPSFHLVFHLFFLVHSLIPSASKVTFYSSSHTAEMSPEASLPFGVFSPPQNSYEWKRALADVKWLCFNQQYKQCALRCNQLIDTASSPVCISQILSRTPIANGVYT